MFEEFLEYFNEDISYMLEFSYVLGQKFQTDIMCKLHELIMTTDDGMLLHYNKLFLSHHLIDKLVLLFLTY